MAQTWRNWGRSVSATPLEVAQPGSIAELQALVRRAAAAGRRVKPVGAGHSFTDIALAPDIQVDMTRLSGIVSVDRDRERVTLLAGTRLFQIPALLAPHGLAMRNLGDIDRQTISGATSTGTHGTGAQFGGIATQIVAATLVTADGELLRVSETEHPEWLPAVALALGALGVLAEVTLQCVPAFVLEAVEHPVPLDQVLGSLDEWMRADHFEFYWFPHTEVALTKVNRRLPGSAERHPLKPVPKWVDEELLSNGVYRLVCGAATAVPAIVPSFSRLAVKLTGDREYSDRSTRVFTQSRTVRFREMEYAVPIEHLVAAFTEVRALIAERGWKISFPIEVRMVAADELWMSTGYQRANGYIAVHRYWREDPTEYFQAVEQIMLRYGGRPHWGKMHFLDAAQLRERYPRFDDFVALRAQLDPAGVFANPYLDRVLGPVAE